MLCAGKERWQVIWHAIRKLRWHRSIHARIDKGAAEAADASMAAMLIFSARSLARRSAFTEKPRVCACVPPSSPQKKEREKDSAAK